MRKNRTENRRRFRRKSTPSQQACECNRSAAPVPTLAGVLEVEKHEDEDTPVTPRMVDQPLLEKWPAGYQGGSFRVVPGGVLLFAKDRPTLKIEEGGTIRPEGLA
jgi:hypothetical protein